MEENKSVIAPMLDSQGAYSNYWCGITPQVRLNFISVDRHFSEESKRLQLLFKRDCVWIYSRRDTTVEQQSTSLPVTVTDWAAFLYPWSTPPCCWTWGRRVWRSWPSSLLMRNTPGHTTTSLCSLSPVELQVTWQTNRLKEMAVSLLRLSKGHFYMQI